MLIELFSTDLEIKLRSVIRARDTYFPYFGNRNTAPQTMRKHILQQEGSVCCVIVLARSLY